jgi:hypothetical protein
VTRFLDGPAAGTTLYLKRAPVYLRAVQGPAGPTHAGDWDALDQLEDEPRSSERIVVYRLEGEPTFCHINRGGRGSGFYRGGAYRVVEPQPTDLEVRSTAAWRAWVSVQVGQPVGDDGTVARTPGTPGGSKRRG